MFLSPFLQSAALPRLGRRFLVLAMGQSGIDVSISAPAREDAASLREKSGCGGMPVGIPCSRMSAHFWKCSPPGENFRSLAEKWVRCCQQMGKNPFNSGKEILESDLKRGRTPMKLRETMAQCSASYCRQEWQEGRTKRIGRRRPRCRPMVISFDLRYLQQSTSRGSRDHPLQTLSFRAPQFGLIILDASAFE